MPDIRDVMTVILGGGQGTRLRPLTSERAKPAVPVGGKYRLIDVSISNCINAGLRRIFVLTQFMSASLHRHIQQTYRFDSFSEGFVHILAAQETPESKDWFQGTADAVRHIQRDIARMRPERVLILPGDQIYRADFRDFINCHLTAGAEATVGVVPVGRVEAGGMGVTKVDASGRVLEFVEKPERPESLRCAEPEAAFLAARGIEDSAECLGSMGVYLFELAALRAMLADASRTDFGREILPDAIRSFRVYAYPFGGYWRDVGTVGTFYEANLDLTEPDPPFSFNEPGARIFTRMRHLPLSRIRDSRLDHAVIAEGCDIDSAEIERSVIGIRAKIGAGTRITDSVLLGNDFYETPGDPVSASREDAGRGVPPVGIGRDCRIERAIVDKNARIGDGVEIVGRTGRPDFECTDYWVRDGIVVIPKGATLGAGTKIR